jgi:hypothetical protein
MKQCPDKESLKAYIVNTVLPVTQQEVEARQQYESTLTEIYSQNLSLDVEKQLWHNYIEFEKSQNNMQRAKLLYERALLSLDSDLSFWLQYVDFIQRTLKDTASVRAKFEARKSSIGAYSHSDIVELMLENALFEEEQSQVQKSRKIYETLV